jgi:hypothetical protein
MDAVAMQKGAASPESWGDSRGKHRNDAVEFGAGQPRIGRGASYEGVQLILRPFARRTLGDDLLGEDIEGRLGRLDAVEPRRGYRADQGGAFDELIARRRKKAPARRATKRVPGASDALQERGDRARGSDLANEVDRPDVDPELERRRGHDCLHIARLESLFDLQPPVLRQAAVVRSNAVLAEALSQVMRDAFRHSSGVDEHQCRLVLAHERRQTVVDFSPLLIRGDRLKVGLRHFDREVEVAFVADVDDGATSAGADQKARSLFDRMHRGREADTLRAPGVQGFETRERKRQMATSFVAHQRVHFVDDDRTNLAEKAARALGRQHQVQRLGRGYENVRRGADDGGTSGRRCVAGTQGGPDGRQLQTELTRGDAQACKRSLEVLLNVGAQRFQRRDVNHLDAVFQLSSGRPSDERVQAREESRERLARARRRCDQRVTTRQDLGPTTCLRRRRRGERPIEPSPNRRMK